MNLTTTFKLFIASVLCATVCYNLTGISTTTPKPEFISELKSEDKKLLLSRIDNASFISNLDNDITYSDKDSKYFAGIANEAWADLGDCTTFTPPASPPVTGTNVSAITYLGGSSDDEVIGVKILSNKTIVVAGEFSSLPSATNTYNPLGIGTPSHQILFFSSDGRTLNTIVEMDAIYDIDITSANEIILYRDTHITKLSSNGQTEIWSSNSGTVGTADGTALYSRGKRLDIGDNNNITVLGNNAVSGTKFDALVNILDNSGNLITNFTITRSNIGGGTYNETWEDIAYDSANNLVFVTGKAQRCSAYQTAFLLAHNTSDGSLAWKNFNLWCSAASDLNLGADSRGKRVEFKNGNLFFIGNADGGNNRFTREEGDGQQGTIADHNIEIDRWNNGAGFGSGKITYFAKMNPTNGIVSAGQFQFSSTGVNQAKSFDALAIETDNLGNVLLGGSSFKDLPNRSALTINGVAIGARVDNETGLITVNSNFDTREQVTCFTGVSGGYGTIEDIEARDGLYAIVGITDGDIVTVNPLDDSRSNQDVFLAVYGSNTLSTPNNSALNNNDLNLFPNPSNGEITLQHKTLTNTPVTIRVIDIKGRYIYNKTFNSFPSRGASITINEQGLFYVQIKSNFDTYVKKVIIY